MKTLLIDVDNVLRDMITPVCKIYNRKYGTAFCKHDVKEYNLNKTFVNMTDDLEYYRDFPIEVLFKAPTEEKNTSLDMNNLYNLYQIVLVTHQLKGFEDYTLKWLEKKEIPYHDICFIKDKFNVKGDVFLDDRIENLEAYKENNPRSDVVAYIQPWNSSWKGYSVENLMVFNNFLVIKNHLGDRRFKKWFFNGSKRDDYET